MAVFSDNTNVNTSTLEHLVAKTVDTVINYSPSTLFFLGNQKRWQGSLMRFPIKYAKNSQGMNFQGLEKFSTTATNNFINMSFDPTGYEINSVISQMEVDVNDTSKVIDLVARRLASDAQDMADAVSTQFYTLQTGKAFLSVLDGVDDGTLGATSYGGLSRTTYTGIAGSYTNVGGNITLSTLRTSFNAATHGSDSPNLILTTKAVWGYLEKLFNPTISHQITQSTLMGYPKFTGADTNGLPNIVAPGTQLKGAMGFNSLMWGGVPIIADEAVPAGYLLMLNTKNWGFYGIPSKHPNYKAVKFYSDTMEGVYNIPTTTGFSFSGYMDPIDQYGRIGHIILEGNLICDNPRNQAVLIGITGA